MKKNKLIQKTFSLQKDLTDCGAGCLQSLINYYGGSISMEILREKSGTSKTGTTLLGLQQCATAVGFDAEGCEADIQALIQHRAPVILHITADQKFEHYVICYSHHFSEDHQFLIGDPARGLVYWTEDYLNEVWISKACLTLKPNEHFQKKTDTDTEKKKWLKNLIKEDQEAIYTIILLGLLFTLSGMSMSIFSQKLIDDILPQKKIPLLVVSILFLGFLLFAKAVIQALREWHIIRQAKAFNERINRKFYGSLLHLPKMFFDTRKIGDFAVRLNDTQRIQTVIKQLISNTAVDISGVLISIGFLFFYYWKVALICLMISPIIFFIIFSYNRKIVEVQSNVMQANGNNESNYIDSIRGIDVIKGFSKQDVFMKKNESVFTQFQTKIFELGKLNLTISFYSGTTLIFFLLLILGFSSFGVLRNEIKIGELMAVIGISGSLLASVTNLALITIPVQEAKVAFDRMFEYSSLQKEKAEGIEIKMIDKIEIKDLDFRFTGRSKILNKVSLSLKKGRITCLLGESGSGKTTFTEILQKNYFPENGEIMINGSISLTTVSLYEWRNLIGVVPQNIQLFNATVLENIILDDKINKQKLQELISYGFEKFINSLPQGLSTLVGEEGINLSGGQKQLIGWLRVLYHDPQFLILDEPTSSLDGENRKFIYELIRKLGSEKIILIINHYLEDMKEISDQILQLDNTGISQVHSL